MLVLTPMQRALGCSLLFLAVLTSPLSAQSSPPITVQWPDDTKPMLRLVFAGFVRVGLMKGQGVYTSEVTAQNVAGQSMPRSVFMVNILDANGVKIGGARLRWEAIPPYRTATAQVQFSAADAPAKVSLLAGKTIPLAVKSVPPGATFSCRRGGRGASLPSYLTLLSGHTRSSFTKTDMRPGSTQLDVGTDELPGGSITLELGGLSQDTVEMRDGTTATGDLISLTLQEAEFQSEGKTKTLERNQIRKIFLVEAYDASADHSSGKDMVQFRDGTAMFGEVLSMSAKEVVLRREGKDLYIERRLLKKVVHEETSVPAAQGNQ